jgi:hypothetical protein
VEQARQEDALREADRVDPDVNHRADDYSPTTPSTGTPVAEPGTTSTTSTGTGTGTTGTGTTGTGTTGTGTTGTGTGATSTGSTGTTNPDGTTTDPAVNPGTHRADGPGNTPA